MRDEKYYKELIDTENANLNARLGWLLTSQSFLFASLAFAWNKESTLAIVISVVGFVVSFSFGIYLKCNIMAFEKIEKAAKKDGCSLPMGLGKDDIPNWWHYLMPWKVVPTVFAFAWLLLIVYSLMKAFKS